MLKSKLYSAAAAVAMLAVYSTACFAGTALNQLPGELQSVDVSVKPVPVSYGEQLPVSGKHYDPHYPGHNHDPYHPGPHPGPQPGPYNPGPNQNQNLCQGSFWGSFSNGVRASMWLNPNGWDNVSVTVQIDGGPAFNGYGYCRQEWDRATFNFDVQLNGQGAKMWGNIWQNGYGATANGNVNNGLSFNFSR